jgi:hypothetical protein
MAEGISWNCTTWLNIVFLILAALLVVRFVRTGGIAMLRMMGGSPDAAAEHDQFDDTGRPHTTDGESAPPCEHHVGEPAASLTAYSARYGRAPVTSAAVNRNAG